MRALAVASLLVGAPGCALSMRVHVGVARIAGETDVAGGFSLGAGFATGSGGVVASAGASHGLEAAIDDAFLPDAGAIGVRAGAAAATDFSGDLTESLRIAPLWIAWHGHRDADDAHRGWILGDDRVVAIGIEAALMRRIDTSVDPDTHALGGSAELSVELYRLAR